MVPWGIVSRPRHFLKKVCKWFPSLNVSCRHFCDTCYMSGWLCMHCCTWPSWIRHLSLQRHKRSNDLIWQILSEPWSFGHRNASVVRGQQRWQVWWQMSDPAHQTSPGLEARSVGIPVLWDSRILWRCGVRVLHRNEFLARSENHSVRPRQSLLSTLPLANDVSQPWSGTYQSSCRQCPRLP